MVLPPGLARSWVGITASGVANTVTTGTLLASPGSGIRIRLWAFEAYPTSTAQAVVNWRAGTTSSIGGVAILESSGSNFLSSGLQVIPGGFAIPSNTALGWEVQAALVSMLLAVIAYTTLEATS